MRRAPARFRPRLRLAGLALALACAGAPPPVAQTRAPPRSAGSDDSFGPAAPVAIAGYAGDAMEPFVTRDGAFLLFNDRNAPGVDTALHYAERTEAGGFRYRGRVEGAQSPVLDGAPSLDAAGELYFVSPRSYARTASVLYRARFAAGRATDVELVPGVSLALPGAVNFDVDVSADGATLVFVDSWFGRAGFPQTADLVIARRAGAGFQRDPDGPRLLENVNSAWLEYAPCLSADGLELFFTRVAAITADAAPQILVARRARPDEPFGVPRRVAAARGFVEAPALSPDGRTLYFHRRVGDAYRIFSARR